MQRSTVVVESQRREGRLRGERWVSEGEGKRGGRGEACGRRERKAAECWQRATQQRARSSGH